MDELLEYLDVCVEEMQDNRVALNNLLTRICTQEAQLKETVKYYKGFADKEDKKSVRYFMTEMTQKEFEELILETNSGITKYKFNTIKKEDIKD